MQCKLAISSTIVLLILRITIPWLFSPKRYLMKLYSTIGTYSQSPRSNVLSNALCESVSKALIAMENIGWRAGSRPKDG